MKKYLRFFMALLMALVMPLGTMTYAATTSDSNTVEVGPAPAVRGTLSGYNNYWYTSGNSQSGDFYVTVTGSYWFTAQTTFSIENFGSNDAVALQLFRPDGGIAYGTLENSGGYITMANSSNWHNLQFFDGQVGTYRVHYEIINTLGRTPSSGRINCWIY